MPLRHIYPVCSSCFTGRSTLDGNKRVIFVHFVSVEHRFSVTNWPHGPDGRCGRPRGERHTAPAPRGAGRAPGAQAARPGTVVSRSPGTAGRALHVRLPGSGTASPPVCAARTSPQSSCASKGRKPPRFGTRSFRRKPRACIVPFSSRFAAHGAVVAGRWGSVAPSHARPRVARRSGPRSTPGHASPARATVAQARNSPC